MGSLGFISASFVSLYSPWIGARLRGQPMSFPPLSSHAPRQLLLTGCLVLWAGRLGYFLFRVCYLPSHYSNDSLTGSNIPHWFTASDERWKGQSF